MSALRCATRKSDAVFGRRRFDGGERRRAPDEQRHRDVREDDDVAEREDGRAVRRSVPREDTAVAGACVGGAAT